MLWICVGASQAALSYTLRLGGRYWEVADTTCDGRDPLSAPALGTYTLNIGSTQAPGRGHWLSPVISGHSILKFVSPAPGRSLSVHVGEPRWFYDPPAECPLSASASCLGLYDASLSFITSPCVLCPCRITGAGEINDRLPVPVRWLERAAQIFNAQLSLPTHIIEFQGKAKRPISGSDSVKPCTLVCLTWCVERREASR